MMTAAAFTQGVYHSKFARSQRSKLFLSAHHPQESNLILSLDSFLAAVNTDQVVVSNTFWSTLSAKLPYFIAAELLATITFIVIASVVSSQTKFLVDKVTSDTQNSKQFKRLNDAPPVKLDFTKLLLCIVIDILGSANEAVPFVGEVVDVVYAPIAALLLRQLFSGSNIIFLLEFAEEILPFTDILPLATICWVIEAFFGSGSLAKALGIGAYGPAGREASSDFDNNNYIDVNTNIDNAKPLQLQNSKRKDK
ncbi:hypothetical protein ACHAWC_000262 [Mediolabrus comicus]